METVNVITRPNGVQIKIVAELCTTPSFQYSVNNYIFRREDISRSWKLCKSAPINNYLNMPVDNYIRNGRSEALRAATHGEILKTNAALMQLCQFETE